MAEDHTPLSKEDLIDPNKVLRWEGETGSVVLDVRLRSAVLGLKKNLIIDTEFAAINEHIRGVENGLDIAKKKIDYWLGAVLKEEK